MFLLYGVGAACYRWVVIVGILWFCYHVFEPYGLAALAQLLAVVVLGGTIAPTAIAGVRFLGNAAHNQGINMRRLFVRAALVAALGGVLVATPLPRRVVAPALVRPSKARRIYVSVPGILTRSVSVAEAVRPGQVLAELKNLELEREIALLDAQKKLQSLQVRHLEKQRVADPALADQVPAAEQALRDMEERWRKRQREQQRLTLTAPIAGRVLPPPRQEAIAGEPPKWQGAPLDPENRGCFLDVGTILCLVGDAARSEAVAVVEQGDVAYVRPQQSVRLYLREAPGRCVNGRVVEVSRLDLDAAPPELLAAGWLPTNRNKQGETRLAGAFYVARIDLPPDGPPLLAGAAGQASIRVAPQSLGARFYRYLRRTFRM
jgi:putative peptide zinc metalloprotease protein